MNCHTYIFFHGMWSFPPWNTLCFELFDTNFVIFILLPWSNFSLHHSYHLAHSHQKDCSCSTVLVNIYLLMPHKSTSSLNLQWVLDLYMKCLNYFPHLFSSSHSAYWNCTLELVLPQKLHFPYFLSHKRKHQPPRSWEVILPWLLTIPSQLKY